MVTECNKQNEVVQVSGTGESLILGLQKGPQDGSEEEAIGEEDSS